MLAGKPEHQQCPTYIAVLRACLDVGFDLEDMLATIHLYAEGKRVVHANFETLIRNGQFEDLADRLYNDYCDVPRIISRLDFDEANFMSRVLIGIIDWWFVTNDDEPDNVKLWEPTEELKGSRKALRDEAMELQDAQVYKQILGVVARHLAQTLKAERDAKSLADDLARDLVSEGSSKLTRRVALAELEEAHTKAQKMHADWCKLANMAEGVRKISGTYVINFGTLTPPAFIQDSALS